MKKYLIFLLIFSLKVQAQIHSAVVCDSITKQPMPSASIRVKDTNLGTTTNTDGKFSLSLKKGIFVVSYIGYLSKSIPSSALPDTVFLSENNQLNEVLVMPDSTLRVLLKKAYNNISKNYPQQPTYLTGFYREVNESVDSSRFNYFSESILKSYKPPYTLAGAEHQGQVQVLKTRKVIHPNYEKNGLRFYGGPYAAIKYDKVLNRSSVINPKFYNKYNYELEKITSYEEKPVYVVAFSSRDSIFNGKIYIDKTDLAFLKIETFRQLDKRELNFVRIDYNEKIIFDKKDDLWYLKYYKGLGNNKSAKERFSLTVEYVTTSIDYDSVKAFTFDKQFNYSDVISRHESNLSNDFFNEYNSVLDQTKHLKDQINIAFKVNTIDSLKNTSTNATASLSNSPSKIEKQNNIRKILSALNIALYLGYSPVQSFDYKFEGSVNNTFENTFNLSASTKQNNIPIILGYNWSYRINKRWMLLYQSGNALRRFSNVDVRKNDFGLAYHFVLNPARKPILIEPSIKYSNVQYGVSFGKTKNPTRGIFIDDKKFNSKSITSGIYQNTEGIKIGVMASIYTKKARKLFFSLDYMQPIKTSKPYFQMKETGFFEFFPQKINIDLNDSRIDLPNKPNLPNPKLSSSFWIGFTYRVGM